MAVTLLVEDDAGLRATLRDALTLRGHEVSEASCLAHALPQLRRGGIEVIVLEMALPDGRATDLIQRAQQLARPPSAVVISGMDDVDATVEAIQAGASDYLLKPMDLDDFLRTVDSAVSDFRKRSGSRALGALEEGPAEPLLIGRSPAIRSAIKAIARAAPGSATVLVQGESGSGKELVARALHRASARHDRPFVGVNCAALSSGLLEAELFGVARGAFTGAAFDRAGWFEAAADGTLFLDEIGELELALQPKLLRVVEEQKFERVGETRSRQCRARLVVATNRDLAGEVKAGRFREDLYYRLDVVSIHVPALRERKSDIPAICQSLLRRLNAGRRAPIREIDGQALDMLMAYEWPGNVRELSNVLHRAALFATQGVVSDAHLVLAGFPGDASPVQPSPPASAPTRRTRPASHAGPRREKESSILADVERTHIEQVLERTGWHKRRACALLRISRPTLDRKIKDFGLQRAATPEADDDVEGGDGNRS